MDRHPRTRLRNHPLPQQQELRGRPRPQNSYANIARVYGNRGWKERPVLGEVRCMSTWGLEWKAKPKEYVKKVERLVEEGRPEAL